MISYIYKEFLKSIVKGSVYFVFAFILLLIPLNIGKKNLDKMTTTVSIYSNVNSKKVDYRDSIRDEIWYPNFYNTVLWMVKKLDDNEISKVFEDIIIDYGNLDEEKIKPNFFKRANLYIDPDKFEYLRYEITYNKDQIDDVKKFVKIFNQSFQKFIQQNIKIKTDIIIENFKRQETIIINEKMNILSNYTVLDNFKNLNINIEHKYDEDSQYPVMSQLDAQKYFVDIDKKKLDELFKIKIDTNSYDWFRSKQYYLGYILAIIISILISMFFTMNKIKKKL